MSEQQIRAELNRIDAEIRALDSFSCRRGSREYETLRSQSMSLQTELAKLLNPQLA